MRLGSGEPLGAGHPNQTASKKMQTTVLYPKELNFANNRNEVGRESRASDES